MKRILTIAAVVAVTLSAVAVATAAVDVIVSPSNMQGWSFGVKNSADGSLAPSVGQFAASPGIPPAGAGAGSFFMSVPEDSGTTVPNQRPIVTLGTNAMQGILPQAVQSFKVSTYISAWSANAWIAPSVQLWLGSAAQQWCFEWQGPRRGTTGGADVGSSAGWQTWDLVTQGSFKGGGLGANSSGNWAWLLTRKNTTKTFFNGGYSATGNNYTDEGNILDTSIAIQDGTGGPNIAAGMSASGDGAYWRNNAAESAFVDLVEITMVDGSVYKWNFEVVPEPASFLALGTGLVGLLGLRRRKS